MVVANAVAALADIRDTSASNVFTLSSQSLFKLLRALNECTEWGQVGACLLSCTIVLTAVHAKPRDGQRLPQMSCVVQSRAMLKLAHLSCEPACMLVSGRRQNAAMKGCRSARHCTTRKKAVQGCANKLVATVGHARCRCTSWMRSRRCPFRRPRTRRASSSASCRACSTPTRPSCCPPSRWGLLCEHLIWHATMLLSEAERCWEAA